MTLSHQKPPNPVQTSVAGTIDVSAQGGGIDVSAAGGAMTVSARNTVDVSAQGGVIVVSARNQVDVSAHGIVSAAGHVLVSGDGRFAVMVSGGQVAITGAIFASAQVSVIGNVATSVAGRVTTHFAQPAGFIVDGGNQENRTLVNVSGASAGGYAIVSAPASGVIRVTRMALTFTSATFATFRQTSASATSINFTGPFRILDAGSVVLDKSDSPWFVTTGAKNLSVLVSGGVGIAGAVWWY